MTRRAADHAPQRHDAEELDLLVQETALSGIARQVLWLDLSTLPPELRQPHHLRLAAEAVAPLGQADRARVFQLPNDDIAVVWRGPADAALQDSLAALFHLFEDEAGPPGSDDGLTRLLALPQDAARIRADLAGMDDAPAPALHQPPRQKLTGTTLAALEAALANANLSRFARRRAVCARVPGGFELRWETRLLSIEELAETLAPDHDLQAEPWLYLRLTRILDRRLLNLLSAAEELRGAGPFSLRLNVASVLSPDFLRFDAALPATLRGQVVLELLPADLLADPAGFQFARDFARARRYRLMLRGVSADLVGVFPRNLAGMDLLQLDWSPDLARLDIDQAAHTVLAGTDDPAALEWGAAQGIELYQGRLADRGLLTPDRSAAANRTRPYPITLGARPRRP